MLDLPSLLVLLFRYNEVEFALSYLSKHIYTWNVRTYLAHEYEMSHL